MRVFGISDVHIGMVYNYTHSKFITTPFWTNSNLCFVVSSLDYPENWEWIKNLSNSAYLKDVLLIAGDGTFYLSKNMLAR